MLKTNILFSVTVASALLCGALMVSAFADAAAAAPAPSPSPSTQPAAAPSTQPTQTPGPFEVYPPAVQLETSRDRQVLVAKFTRPDGVTLDVTAECQFTLSDPNLAKVEGNVLKPQNDGAGQVLVKYADQTFSVPLTVKAAQADRPISFKMDVMPVFLRSGCNTGGCHGSARGKDGFMLSLFGYDAEGDFNRITREQATRRINLALPEESLLLTKALGAVTHTGGTRIKPGSEYHDTMLRWLQAGAPQDPAEVATPVSLDLYPKNAVLEGEGAKQQFIAIAKYSDGTDRDVTNLALFLSNNDNS